jgi:hypothetical protein
MVEIIDMQPFHLLDRVFAAATLMHAAGLAAVRDEGCFGRDVFQLPLQRPTLVEILIGANIIG